MEGHIHQWEASKAWGNEFGIIELQDRGRSKTGVKRGKLEVNRWKCFALGR